MDEYKCKHPRRPFAATVYIQVGADAISGATRDISTTELYIESLVMPPLDTPYPSPHSAGQPRGDPYHQRRGQNDPPIQDA